MAYPFNNEGHSMRFQMLNLSPHSTHHRPGVTSQHMSSSSPDSWMEKKKNQETEICLISTKIIL